MGVAIYMQILFKEKVCVCVCVCVCGSGGRAGLTAFLVYLTQSFALYTAVHFIQFSLSLFSRSGCISMSLKSLLATAL